MFILFGCQSNSIKWNVEESEYKTETIVVEKKNVLVIKRIHDTNNNEKFVEFNYYLTPDGITDFVLHYNKFFLNVEETKSQLSVVSGRLLNVDIDEYFKESLKDLLIQKNKNDRNNFSANLVKITDIDNSLMFVITLSNHDASYSSWDGKTIVVESGTKDSFNIESKVYYSNE